MDHSHRKREQKRSYVLLTFLEMLIFYIYFITTFQKRPKTDPKRDLYRFAHASHVFTFTFTTFAYFFFFFPSTYCCYVIHVTPTPLSRHSRHCHATHGIVTLSTALSRCLRHCYAIYVTAHVSYLFFIFIFFFIFFFTF